MSKKLAGSRVLVTRPTAQSDSTITAIEAAGGVGIRFPVIDISPRDAAAINDDLSGMTPPDITVFISSNAARFGTSAVDSSKVAAIGPATRKALDELGISAEIFPQDGFDSEHLLQHAALADVAGKTIRIVRGNRGRELLAKTLRSRGAEVQELPVYERTCAAPTAEAVAELAAGWRSDGVDIVVVMSVESLQNLLQILPAELQNLLPSSLLVSPSRRVIQTAQEQLPDMPTRLAGGIEARDLVDAMVRS